MDFWTFVFVVIGITTAVNGFFHVIDLIEGKR